MHEAVVRDRGKRDKLGKRGIRALKARVGRKYCISRGGQIEQWMFTS